MSTSIGGLKLFMETVLDAKPWLTEPSLIPIPWRSEQAVLPVQRRLRIGIMLNDGVVTPHPPVTRALAEVTARLKQLWGVSIVDWTPHDHDLAWSIIASLYYPDGASEEKRLIDEAGEPWLPLTSHIIQDNPYVKSLTIPELWDWQLKRASYEVETAQRWNEAGIDALLCPVGPSAAPLLETAKWWGYTSVFNLLDYPAAVFPVTAVDPTVDVKQEGYQPVNERDRYNYELCKLHSGPNYALTSLLCLLQMILKNSRELQSPYSS